MDPENGGGAFRGPPFGPPLGPPRAPENHGNRKNHKNHQKSWNSMKFMDFHEIYRNFMKFHENHDILVKWRPLRPHGRNHWYSLGFPWCFWGPPGWKMHNFTWFQHFHGKSWNFIKSVYFTIKHVFYWFTAFRGARTLKKHQWSLRNINGFSHGGGSTYILLKIHHFPKNSRNFVNFHEFPWKPHIFHKMGARPPPWWKPLIFLREFWCFWRVRAPQNWENPENPRFYGKMQNPWSFPHFH